MTESAPPSNFTIGTESLQGRTRNVIAGAVLGLLLALLVGWGHLTQPGTYNAVLLWSVIGFIVLANVIGYLRHRRYLRLARTHRLEVGGGGLRFLTGSQVSELSLADIAAVSVYRNRKGIGHIQVQRTDNRGIRLEGYGDMQGLAAALKEQVPPAHWRDG